MKETPRGVGIGQRPILLTLSVSLNFVPVIGGHYPAPAAGIATKRFYPLLAVFGSGLAAGSTTAEGTLGFVGHVPRIIPIGADPMLLAWINDSQYHHTKPAKPATTTMLRLRKMPNQRLGFWPSGSR
jgi:hypothetical protein